MIRRIGFLIFAGMLLFVFSNNFVSAKNTHSKESASIVNKNVQSESHKLSLIDKYQAEYFKIYKRKNDALLNNEYDYDSTKDTKELKKLTAKIEKQITDKNYLKKYKKQKKQIGKCSGITTIEINACAERDYNATGDLLDEVYKKIESKISAEDFKNLALNQNKWQKEVEDYEKSLSSLETGTLGAVVHFDYQIDMKEFRTLLLLLYL